MLDIARTRAAAARLVIPDRLLHGLLAAGSLGSFGWLLAHDQVHPLVVYFLQVYLTF